MPPFILLLIFILLAVSAFVAFAVLTRKPSTPVREDWKKFLSSFAGTALALSVGFISFMLQTADRAQQTEIDENAQIRARILYSVTQKKFESSLFIDMEKQSRKLESSKICNPGESTENRQKQLAELGDAPDFQDARDVYTRLFSSLNYNRNVLLNLLKETKFPARVDPDLSAAFLDGELNMLIQGPFAVEKAFELMTTKDLNSFCTKEKNFRSQIKDVTGNARKIQFTSCAAYAVAELPTKNALETSKALMETINKSFPSPYSASEEQKKQAVILQDALAEKAGSAKGALQECLKVAEVTF